MGIRIISGDGATLTEGGMWSLVVDVRDVETCARADDPPTVTVTLPDGTTALAVVDTTSVGLYLVTYTVAAAGRHIASVVTDTHGTTAAVATVRGVVDAAGMPDVAEIRAYPGSTISATDEEIEDALAAETDAQLAACRMPAAYPADLRQALKRRTVRNLAMRARPLAYIEGDADGGDALMLPGTDPEVRRLEKPWRRLKMG